jgi:hypothetical protein
MTISKRFAIVDNNTWVIDKETFYDLAERTHCSFCLLLRHTVGSSEATTVNHIAGEFFFKRTQHQGYIPLERMTCEDSGQASPSNKLCSCLSAFRISAARVCIPRAGNGELDSDCCTGYPKGVKRRRTLGL